MMMNEKKKMLETRFSVRREADVQKREMMQKVEKMKAKGNFDKSELAKMGINLDNFEMPKKDIFLDDGSSSVRSHDDRLYDARANLDLDALRGKQEHEIKRLKDNENAKRGKREEMLHRQDD